jgi:hypothetical protein
MGRRAKLLGLDRPTRVESAHAVEYRTNLDAIGASSSRSPINQAHLERRSAFRGGSRTLRGSPAFRVPPQLGVGAGSGIGAARAKKQRSRAPGRGMTAVELIADRR